MTQFISNGSGVADGASCSPHDPGAHGWVATLIRCVGCGLLLVGLIAAGFVIHTTWGLLSDQTLITTVSAEIEQRSGVGAYADGIVNRLIETLPELGAQRGRRTSPGPASATAAAPGQTPYAYFLAWAVVTILLAVIAHMTLSAMSHGARLLNAGGAAPTRKLVQQLTAELNRMNQRDHRVRDSRRRGVTATAQHA